MMKEKASLLRLVTSKAGIWYLPVILLIVHRLMLHMKFSAWGDIVTPLLFIMAGVSLIPIYLEKTPNFRSVFFYMSGILVYGAAEGIWSFMENFTQQSPMDSMLLSCLYFVTNLCFFTAILLFIIVNWHHYNQTQFLQDLLTGILINLGFLMMIYLENVALSDARIFDFIYLCINIISLTALVVRGLSLRSYKPALSDNLIFIGLLMFVIADGGYINAVIHQAYAGDGLIDFVYVASLVMLSSGIKACYMDFKSNRPQQVRKFAVNEGKSRRLWLLFLLPVLSLLLFGFHPGYLLYFLSIIIIHLFGTINIQKNIDTERLLEENSGLNLFLQKKVEERTRQLQFINEAQKHLLERDRLTGLLSRESFFCKMDELIVACSSTCKVYLIKADLEKFRNINNLYGNTVGDEVLKAAARRICSIDSERTCFARLDGNEFAILYYEDRDSNQIMNKIEQLVSEFQTPFAISPFTILLNMNFGIAAFPEHAGNRNDLMNCAKSALEQAKERKLCYSFYDEELYEKEHRRQEIEIALKKADMDEEFALYYQPEFFASGQELFGMEALIRCTSPYTGPVGPMELIKIAEETGYILKLGEWVMKNAMRQIAAWNSEYGTDFTMGINVSPLQIQDINFIGLVKNLILETGINPKWLNFEITENWALGSQERIGAVLRELSELGITVSIDDFGTGYSSYGYIKQFSVDYLKIDKLLIDTIAAVPNDLQVLKAIVAMAKALEIRTIAEGAETREQVRLLEKMGCDIIQGYYYGKPVPSDEFAMKFLDAADDADEAI